ncbi:BadF/BadG/BcrA/BcrD ATPase family protein [Pseudophaeobacter sp.]|uniref:BadF/BadG/BcrA/BcrD ATPase family protein n=1 Tax=Pseudophaeobacter sp. TaxID=1971739 RepID=UPI003297830D
MKTDPSTRFVAVDGGGSRCRIALHQCGNITKVEVGAANVSSDFNGAIAQIRQGLTHLSAQSGLSAAQLAELPAYLGLAGVVSAEIALSVKSALPFTRSQVEDDRPAALRGALGPGDGMIAHCGTGSFLASQLNGKRRIIGGWGAQLGDQASAQWLGRQALVVTLDVCDGLEAASDLSRAMLARLQTSAQIVAFAASANPMEFGTLAKEVTAAAQRSDPLALALMQRGAAYLSESLVKLGWQPQLPICLTGGLAGEYQTYLPAEIQAAVQQPKADPLSGALELAQHFARQIETGTGLAGGEP